ncbi:MAG: protein O-mannosyl-transferase family, partial [Acidobacteriota bacterium]
ARPVPFVMRFDASGWMRDRWGGRLAMASLVAAQSVLYLKRLHPGAAEGDSGELQWAAPLLGICHSPGYALQVSAGKVFSLLPVGRSVAWRMNLMSAVFGVIGCIALFSAVRRITGRSLPAWVAGMMLAFSSVYWSQATIAEVYVFGAAFILLAIEAATRLIETGRVVWLATMAVMLGVAVAERPSEIMIVPAFLGLWLGSRKRVSMTAARWLAAAGWFLLPFVVAFGLNIAHSDPHRFAVRDDMLRDTMIGYQPGEVTFDYTHRSGVAAATRSTLSFMLGLSWSPRIGWGGARDSLRKYAWLVSGLGIWGSRFAPAGMTDVMLRGGMSLGPPGVLLALAGVFFWRRRPGWALLGLGLCAGNLVFLLVYKVWDSLTFTIPGLIGMSLLAGLGCAGPPDLPAAVSRTWRWRVHGTACVVACLLLVPINDRYVDRDTLQERSYQELLERVARAPLPREAVILTRYWPAMELRYLFWIQAVRRDVSVIHAARGTHLRLAVLFRNEGRPVYFTRGLLPRARERALLRDTPEQLRPLGFVRFENPR